MTALVKVHINSHVGTIILNRPDKRNALSRALLRELQQSFDDLHREKRVRAVIITGGGSAFCAGMDLNEMLETSRQANAQTQWHDDAVQYRDLLETMLRFPKPLICGLNGPAVAGGVGLVLGCDLVVASEHATLSLPEPRRGIVAGMVAPLLAFRAGGGNASRLLMTGEPIDAPTAERMGIVHYRVATEQVWAKGVEVASICCQSAPESLQLTKKLLNETIGEVLFTQLSSGAAASAAARTTSAAVEGLTAFAEKRPPNWK